MNSSLRSPSSRAGAARGLLLAAVAVLLGLAVLLVLKQAGTPPPVGVVMPDLGSIASGSQPGELTGSFGESAPPATLAPVRVGAVVGADGVRLAGNGKLAGRVVDVATGRGVGGVRVELLALPPAAAEFAANLLRLGRASTELGERILPLASTLSAADGRFEFEGVREGNFYLEARGPLHVPDGAFRARVAPSGDGGPVDVLVRAGGAVEGRVELPNGSPARGTVALYQGATTFIDAARRADLVRLEADLDARGGFAIAGVPPGEGYDITVVGPGSVLTHTLGLVVRAGETTRVELTTRIGGVVTGRVVGDDPLGEAGSARVPVAGALVGPVPRGLRDLAFVETMLRQIGTRAGPDGSYRIEGVPPGEFDIAAIGALHLPGHVGPLRIGTGGVVEAPDLVLETGPLARGRIVDGEGRPIPGVDVRWNLAERNTRSIDFTFTPLLYQAQRYFDFPRSDEEGRFVAGPLPGEAPHSITFWKPGFAWNRLRFDPATSPEELTVVLERGGAVEGIVMDLVGGVPAATFTIETPDRIDQEAGEPGAWNPFAGGQLFEGTGGRFSIDAMRPGSRSLTVRAPGFVPKQIDVAIVEGERTRGVVVELERGASIAGRVIDPEGRPVAGAQVVALDTRGRLSDVDRARTNRGPVPFGAEADDFLREAPIELAAGVGLLAGGSVTADREGLFEIGGLPGRGARLLAVQRDFAPLETEPFEFEPGARLEGVELVLSRGGGLEGRVTDRFGRPVANAIVIASIPPGRDRQASARLYQGASDADGRYRVAPMRGGSYFLLVTRGDEQLSLAGFFGSLHFDLVSVPDNEVITFDIVDPSASAARVFGTVSDAGLPVEGGILTAVNFDTENLLGVDFKLTPVRQDGGFEFAGLAPGDYQFSYQGGAGRRGEVRITAEVPDRPEWRFDVALPQGAIAGRVLDGSTRAPLANADVQLRPLSAEGGSGLLGAFLGSEARVLRERTDAAGDFVFRGLESGGFELTVRGPRNSTSGRFAPSTPRVVDVEDGRMSDGVEVALAPSRVLRGRVVDGQGLPVAGARVTAIAREGTPTGGERGRSDGDGRFELDGLAAGRFDVVATATGYADGSALDVDTEAEASAELAIVLGEGAQLRVRAMAPDGRALAGAIGRLTRTDGEVGSTAQSAQSALEGFLDGRGISGTDGWIDFGRLAPGRWTVTLTRGALAGSAESALLREGERAELRIDLR